MSSALRWWHRRSTTAKVVIGVMALFFAIGATQQGAPGGSGTLAAGANGVLTRTQAPDDTQAATPGATAHTTPEPEPGKTTTAAPATPAVTATATPTASPSANPTPAPTATPEPTPSAEPSPTPAPTATPVPMPTPVVASIDTQLTATIKATTVRGGLGTYTWTSAEMRNELETVAWVVKAPSAAACSVTWRFIAVWDDTVGRQVRAGAADTVKGSKQFVYEYGPTSGELEVVSTCPAWSLTLTSEGLPKGWNPWGYSFSPGRLIWAAPDEFCSYFDCIGSFWESTNGYVAQCWDGMFSHSGGRSGACSWHGGVRRPLYRP